MDEQTLNIILECPVCLNTFNESSRVLPCQHTFCYECLEDIVAKRGILHCPECRVCHIELFTCVINSVEILHTYRFPSIFISFTKPQTVSIFYLRIFA